jgi:uncharacterized protein
MIAVDTNLLVYAHRRESPFHERARICVESLQSASNPWAIPWPCLHEFVGIITHPRIFKTPTPIEIAFATVEQWLAAENLHFLAESDGYLDKLRDLSRSARVVGPRVHDARVAALCLHHGVRELWTADRDFSAFPRLKTRNPLVEAGDFS